MIYITNSLLVSFPHYYFAYHCFSCCFKYICIYNFKIFINYLIFFFSHNKFCNVHMTHCHFLYLSHFVVVCILINLNFSVIIESFYVPTKLKLSSMNFFIHKNLLLLRNHQTFLNLFSLFLNVFLFY